MQIIHAKVSVCMSTNELEAATVQEQKGEKNLSLIHLNAAIFAFWATEIKPFAFSHKFINWNGGITQSKKRKD